MNVKRFVGRNSREAMQKVRQAFGDNAVVLSTKPCTEGVEILAMPPESVEQIERFGEGVAAGVTRPAPLAPHASHPTHAPQARSTLRDRAAQQVPQQAAPQARQHAQQQVQPQRPEQPVQDDVGQLAMSTLSFQDYVRERMLKKRQAEMRAQAMKPVPVSPEAIEQRLARRDAPADHLPTYAELVSPQSATPSRQASQPASAQPAQPARRSRAVQPPLDSELGSGLTTPAELDALHGSDRRSGSGGSRADQAMMSELRAMKGLIEERFGALAFMERLQKSPKQAQLTARLIDCGFSPALIRKLVDGLGDEVADETAWATDILQRNLVTGEADPAIEDQGGVFALVGSTGVGKTTSTAKLAAAFATRHGAANLGLITLDAYRLGAHEQLRAYGRILGVPVHTAHDRVALEDLLDLLSSKKMVLIDTAGLAQRDSRTRELLEMLSHRSIKRLLVVNAAAQGETIEDVLIAYKATQAKGIVLSKVDEAVKLGPALDALIRHRLKVVAVANGQRVPEDWHRLTAHALMQRALRNSGTQAWRLDANDVNLLFATPPAPPAPRRSSRAASAAPVAGRSGRGEV